MKRKEAYEKDALHFRLMVFFYKFRDFFLPRKFILKEAEIRQGSTVLDFGCGPGSYIIPLTKMVGSAGRVYALDVHPVAIQRVERLRAKRRLSNVIIIRSDCQTGLPERFLDVILLYDVFHELKQPDLVLEELYRILKPTGILSVRDHHLREDEIISGLTGKGLFRFIKKGRKTYSFKIKE